MKISTYRQFFSLAVLVLLSAGAPQPLESTQPFYEVGSINAIYSDRLSIAVPSPSSPAVFKRPPSPTFVIRGYSSNKARRLLIFRQSKAPPLPPVHLAR
jgi:hypothetical protein